LGFSVSHVQSVRGKGGKKNKFKQFNLAEYEKAQITNYELLKSLGFRDDLIAENKRLGLRERNMEGLGAYLVQHEMDSKD
jgi:hypothetical protein